MYRTATQVIRLLAVLMLVAYGGSAARAASESPAEFLNALATEAIKLLSNATAAGPARDAEFHRLFTKSFDVEAISRFVLARHWRNATDEERTEFRQAFEDYVVAVYGRRLQVHPDVKLIVGEARQQDEDVAVVPSRFIHSFGEPLVIDWRLVRRDGRWRIIDVVIGGVSMAMVQRSDFAAVIQRDGGTVAGLTARLRVLAERLSEPPT